MMRVWFDKLQRYYHTLEEFEDDDVEDFAGYNLVEEPEEEAD